ncbi:MAG: hypothetical protein LBU83_08605 [Bacteroidales bacterium]|jgi:hypothetical protein|nr:hypothetical protein [Bacteroidales bacterium]
MFALLTAAICAFVYFLDEKDSKHKLKHGKKIRFISFLVIAVFSLAMNLIIDNRLISYLVIVGGSMNYYNYFLMKENDKEAKIIFIISHILIVIYEILCLLYIFALMDFIITLSIIGSLIFLLYNEFKAKKKAKLYNGQVDCIEIYKKLCFEQGGIVR